MLPKNQPLFGLFVLIALLLNGLPLAQTVQARGAFAPASACILRVISSAPDGGDGLSWSTAYNQLQPAIEAASTGCEVWVAAGRYVPPVGYAFRLKAGVKVYGGFVGNETNRYQRDWVNNVTTLSGDRNDDDAGGFDHMTENTRVLEAVNVFDKETLLDGFTLSGGSSKGDAGCGGAIYNSNSYARYANLVINQNQATWGGGICSMNTNDSIFTNLRITNNHAGSAAGMAISATGDVALNNVYFYGNGAVDGFGISRYVGGLRITSGNINLNNVWFQNNYAQYIGAVGISGSTSNVNFNNTVMYNNFAEGYGGGLNLDNTVGSVFLENCTLFLNHAGGWGAAINNLGPTGAYNVRNSIIWGNVLNSNEPSNLNGNLPAMSYSIIQGVVNDDVTHIYGDQDPLFASTALPANLRLQPGSPAINAGLDDFVPPDTYDLDHDKNTSETLPYDYEGSPRISGTAVDLGAFETGGTAAAPVISEGDRIAYNPGLVIHASDANGDLLTWDIPADPLLGTATLTPAADGLSVTVTYTPSPQNNAVSFPVRVSDGGQAGAGGTDIVIISYTPTPPGISDIPNQTTNRNIPIESIPFTVSDPNNNPSSLVLTAESSNTTLLPVGNIIFAGNGVNRTLRAAPAQGQSGTATVTVRVSSGPLSSTDSFLLTVTNHNTPPNAVDDVTKLPNGAHTLTIQALNNDTDADRDPLTISAVTQGQYGSVIIDSSKSLLGYTPGADYPGEDTFTYTVVDGFGGSDTATVTVTTTPRAEVSLNTAHSSLKALTGSIIPLEFTVQNAGPDSTSIGFGMQLPDGVDLVSQGSTDGCTQTGRNISCGPVVAPQTGLVIRLNLAVGDLPDGAELTCHALIEASVFDPNLANNQIDVTLQVYTPHIYLPYINRGE